MRTIKKNASIVLVLLMTTCMLSPIKSGAQQVSLTLDNAINIARDQSFEAFKAKNLYLEKAIDYESYLKSLYPKLNLSITPASYSHSIEEQWDSKSERYSPYDLQSISSNGSLLLNQPVKLLGGNLSLNSYLYRYSAFKNGINDYTTFISYPVRLSYTQDLFGVNTYKWKAKIEPLKFEATKKEYLEEVEAVTIKTVQLFFNLLISEKNYQIAQLNKNNADTLYAIGQKKIEIGTITRDNFLQLQLKKVNAGIALEQKKQAKEQANLALNNFLELPQDENITCVIPNNLPDFEIDQQLAIAKVFENNSDIISLQNKINSADQAIAVAKSNRITASFSTTLGLNQNQENLANVYSNLKDQQAISLSISVPLIDWGDNKRKLVQARLNKELVSENARKQKDNIGIEVLNMVNNFNINQLQVKAALQADSIAQIAYQAVQQQYLLGKINILNLNSSYNDMQNAQNYYLNSLMNYWIQLYNIRKLCLYDFEQQTNLDTDFDQMLNNIEY